MLVREVLKTGAITCTADLSLEEVAELMKANDVGCVVVVDEDQSPIGLVTDRDIVLRAVASGMDMDAPVESVMTESVETLSEDRDVMEVAEKMSDEEVRRLPVVDASGKVVGVISLGDVLRVVTERFSRLVQGIAPQDPKIAAAA